MKIGTIANNKEQCLVFYVDESFSISADEISKKFQVRIKNTMQMFIKEDADKLNEITNNFCKSLACHQVRFATASQTIIATTSWHPAGQQPGRR